MVRILLAVGTAVSLFFVPWTLLAQLLTPLSDTVQEQVQEAVDGEMDGIIVYVQKGDQEPEFYTAGWHNRDEKIPVDHRSFFKIASISKLYEAVAVAKLVHEGKLSLDRTLAEYLPEFATRIENADEITLRMMVQHRSGIPNYVDHPDFPWSDPFKERSETYQLVLDMPADFEPNKKHKYSNTNYLLIGDIMDKTLGYSHHTYIKEKIVRPLGLNNTYSLLDEVELDKVMSGYFVGYELDIKGNDFINPGGSMIATIEDVGVFLRALNDGTLLNDKEQEIYSSIYVFEHTGHLPGYQSIARYHKDLDTVVIQFNNTSGGKMWNYAEIIYKRIVRILRKQ